MSNKTFLKILAELGYPRIYLVPPIQFEKVDGDKIDGLCGNSSIQHPIITVNKGLRGRVLSNTIYHEIAHKIFPHRPHWWIECFAEKMAGGGGRGSYSKMYNHSPSELPNRARLLELSKRATQRFNSK